MIDNTINNQSKNYWKLYEAKEKRINMLNERQGEEDDKTDKWLMTLAAGSFGLSFMFINNIVPVTKANHLGFLITAWSCFIAVLIFELIGFMISSFVHTNMAKAEQKKFNRALKGKKTKYKKWSTFANSIAVLGYFSLLSFISGSVFLILFIGINLLAKK